jgi:hypothetical protein
MYRMFALEAGRVESFVEFQIDAVTSRLRIPVQRTQNWFNNWIHSVADSSKIKWTHLSAVFDTSSGNLFLPFHVLSAKLFSPHMEVLMIP